MAQDASNTSYNVLWFFDNYNDFRNWQKIYTDSVSLLSPKYMVWNYIIDSNYCQSRENY